MMAVSRRALSNSVRSRHGRRGHGFALFPSPYGLSRPFCKFPANFELFGSERALLPRVWREGLLRRTKGDVLSCPLELFSIEAHTAYSQLPRHSLCLTTPLLFDMYCHGGSDAVSSTRSNLLVGGRNDKQLGTVRGLMECLSTIGFLPSPLGHALWMRRPLFVFRRED